MSNDNDNDKYPDNLFHLPRLKDGTSPRTKQVAQAMIELIREKELSLTEVSYLCATFAVVSAKGLGLDMEAFIRVIKNSWDA